MAEYDALIVFLLSAVLMIFYIYIEARPKGSNFIGKKVLFLDFLENVNCFF